MPISVKNAAGATVSTSTLDDATGAPITGQTLPSGSGQYGWLSYLRQLIADRLPAALAGGRLDVNVGASELPTGAATEATMTIISNRVSRAGLAITTLSGTITTGGTSQSLDVANAERRFFLFQNLSTADLWVRLNGATAAANQPSVRFSAGEMMLLDNGVPNGALGVFGATTGQAFTCLVGV